VDSGLADLVPVDPEVWRQKRQRAPKAALEGELLQGWEGLAAEDPEAAAAADEAAA
jgi:hypothetical protein